MILQKTLFNHTFNYITFGRSINRSTHLKCQGLPRQSREDPH